MKIEQVNAVVPTDDGALVVIEAKVAEPGQQSIVELAIATDLAAQVAIALLATTAAARAKRDGMEPALSVLAAGVVPSGLVATVRLQLLFSKGAVLPLEIPLDAARALHRSLGGLLASEGSEGLPV